MSSLGEPAVAMQSGCAVADLLHTGLGKTYAGRLRMTRGRLGSAPLLTPRSRVPLLCSDPCTTVFGRYLYSATSIKGEQALIGELRSDISTAAFVVRQSGMDLWLLGFGSGFVAPLPGLSAHYLYLRAALTDSLDGVGAYGRTAGLFGFLGRGIPAEAVLDGADVVDARRLELRSGRIEHIEQQLGHRVPENSGGNPAGELAERDHA